MGRVGRDVSAHPSNAPVLILEPHSDGHRASYVRWLVKELKSRGECVIVATSAEPERTSTMKSVEALIGDQERFITARPPGSSRSSPVGVLGRVWDQWHYFGWFRAVHADVEKRFGPVRVVVPYVDYFLDIAGLLGSPFSAAPWVGITMRSWSTDASGLSSRIRLRLLRRLAEDPRVRAIFSINAMDAGPLSNAQNLTVGPLRPLLDPAELPCRFDRDFARDRLGLRRNSTVLLVFGTMDRRKGLQQLLTGLERVDGARRPVVLIVGRQDDQSRDLVRGRPYAEWRNDGRIIVVDEFVDDEMQGLAFAASDLVWVGYVGHQSMSGVLVLAGVAGLPVIGCSVGEIGRMIRDAGLGLAVDVGNPDAIAAAVVKLLEPGHRHAFGVAAQDALKAHTPRFFAGTILDALGLRT